MIFNSIDFLLYFLPAFLLIYYITPAKLKNLILFLGSVIFYTYGEPYYIVLLVLSIMLAYFSAGLIERDKQSSRREKRLIFVMTLMVQAGLLLFYKCAPVILNETAGEKISLPLGISFYTFQIISYLTDVYLERIPAESSPLRLAVYVSMFPKLSAGPIVSYQEVSGAIGGRRIHLKDFDFGLKDFIFGLCLKVLLADRLGILWHEIQTAGYISISTPLAWLGAIAFSMQLYFDFYGYSLMAIGLGRMLGFTLPDNFRNPYMSRSVREFYRRWHMTLGNWFQRYVYIPLGGSRKGNFRTIFNLAIVWFLTSFWHGAGINFFLWGMSLFVFIALEKLIDRKGLLQKSNILSRLYVWFVIVLTWVCFAIPDLSDIKIYFGRLFALTEGVNVRGGDIMLALSNYGLLILTGLIFCTPLPKKIYDKCKNHVLGMFVIACLFWLCIHRILTAVNNPFLYLRF